MKVRRIILMMAVMLMTEACGEGIVANKYSSLPARFSFNPVNSISQLYSSCESQGEWCTIILSNKKFYFTKASGSQGQANQTAQDNYSYFIMGLSGFIVGLPNVPELGMDYPVLTCYDLACPNCYAEQSVARRLTLQEGGFATCQSGSNPCRRTYNLNGEGIVSSGEAGKSLYRYRVYYGNNTLSINNN